MVKGDVLSSLGCQWFRVHEDFSGRQRINFLCSTGRQTLYGNKLHHWLMPHSGRENGKMPLDSYLECLFISRARVG